LNGKEAKGVEAVKQLTGAARHRCGHGISINDCITAASTAGVTMFASNVMMVMKELRRASEDEPACAVGRKGSSPSSPCPCVRALLRPPIDHPEVAAIEGLSILRLCPRLRQYLCFRSRCPCPFIYYVRVRSSSCAQPRTE